jgi:hypothetical protein
MIFSSYNSHSVNFTPPLSRVETTSEKDAAISELYSAAIGKTAEIECLKYKGYQFYPNGDFYEGDFVQSQPHGRGKQIYSNGNFYEGDFVQSKPHGKGKKIYPNGDLYEGDLYAFTGGRG